MKRDPSKVYWKRQWGKDKIKALQDEGKWEVAKKEAIWLTDEYIKPAEGQARKEKIELTKSQMLAEKAGQSVLEDEDRKSLIKSNISQAEEPKTLPGKLNAWEICKGKQLPAWCVPRNRNKQKDETKNGEVMPITRANEEPRLATNSGVEEGTQTKEHMWAGEFDRTYGEFYKKMDLSDKDRAKEVVLFYCFWNLYRKLIFAITLVFFHEHFGIQCYGQIGCSGVMMAYLWNYWPCARYIDNVSKLFNELCFVGMLMSCSFLKEMTSSINTLSLSDESSPSISAVAPMMDVVLIGNVGFHCARLAHNTI